MAEYWDLFDRQRRPLGRTMRRGDPVPEGCCHVVVQIFTFDTSGRLLITRRSLDRPNWPGYWECSGGSILAGEDSLSGAERELLEETGLAVGRTAEKLEFLDFILQKGRFADCYLAVAEDGCSLRLQPEEVIDAAWVNGEELSRLVQEGRFVSTVWERFCRVRPLAQEILECRGIGFIF